MKFYKYHGTGNDFILLDNRDKQIRLSTTQIAFLCNRHLGIGADGLMLLEKTKGYDFRMVYYNSDGREGSMCGNGGRCMVAFAHRLGMIDDTAYFIASDGPHRATIRKDGLISLRMKDVGVIFFNEDGSCTLDTGSLHYVYIVKGLKDYDVYNEGKKIRNLPEYVDDGINVNFIQFNDGNLMVRTYERGVEDETLSCGTGATAAAIAAVAFLCGTFDRKIETRGGQLEVSFMKETSTSATNVVLTGPAEFVFEGEIEV